MDPITLILTALMAGAAAGGQAAASDAIKDAYHSLKMLLQRKFAGKAEAEVPLVKYEEKPQVWEAPLKDALTQEHVDQDIEIIQTAQRVLALAHPEQAARGKYNVQISGNAQVKSVISGEGNIITQAF